MAPPLDPHHPCEVLHLVHRQDVPRLMARYRQALAIETLVRRLLAELGLPEGSVHTVATLDAAECPVVYLTITPPPPTTSLACCCPDRRRSPRMPGNQPRQPQPGPASWRGRRWPPTPPTLPPTAANRPPPTGMNRTNPVNRDAEPDIEALLHELLRRKWTLLCCGHRTQPEAVAAVQRTECWADVVVLRGPDHAGRLPHPHRTPR
jgi:hypothetical protein